jgi:hypothetical protein
MFGNDRAFSLKNLSDIRLGRPQCFLAKVTLELNRPGLRLVDDQPLPLVLHDPSVYLYYSMNYSIGTYKVNHCCSRTTWSVKNHQGSLRGGFQF